MSTQSDPLVRPSAPDHGPDRLNYALGRMLSAEDFQDEQLYHRGRLARALSYVVGEGTLAGLRVLHPADLVDRNTASAEELALDELLVRPGLAIDRLGRLIEVLEPYCIRVDRWFDALSADDLLGARDLDAGVVRADVFLSFQPCERGKTPAFASGPYDAIDAIAADKLRDSHEIELVLRSEDTPLPAQGAWPTLSELAAEDAPGSDLLAGIRRWIVDEAWREGSDQWDAHGPKPPDNWPQDVDPSAVFLARVELEVEGGPPVVRRGSGADSFRVDDAGRAVAVPTSALLQWLFEVYDTRLV